MGPLESRGATILNSQRSVESLRMHWPVVRNDILEQARRTCVQLKLPKNTRSALPKPLQCLLEGTSYYEYTTLEPAFR